MIYEVENWYASSLVVVLIHPVIWLGYRKYGSQQPIKYQWLISSNLNGLPFQKCIYLYILWKWICVLCLVLPIMTIMSISYLHKVQTSKNFVHIEQTCLVSRIYSAREDNRKILNYQPFQLKDDSFDINVAI